MSGRQRAIILSYHQPPILTYLVDALDTHGYDVVLMVTGRGPNYALPDGAYETMGAQITGVFNAYDFPILAVKNISQAIPSVTAVDADLALCMGFPYRITEKLLSTRTKFVNFHPGPLPSLAGGMPFVWPILRPDLFSLDDYSVTIHYMTPVIDDGRVILARKIKLPDGVDARNVTADQIRAAAYNAMCQAAERVVKLVKEGYQGRDLEEDSHSPERTRESMARHLTDDERTITTNMTVEQADRIWRARFGPRNPFFRSEQHGLFKVVALKRSDVESEVAVKAKQQSSGAYRMGTSRLFQSFQDGTLELDLRKL